MAKIEVEYRCYICDESKEPIRLLPCLHFFCSSCLANYLSKYYLDYEQISKKIDYTLKEDSENYMNLSLKDPLKNTFNINKKNVNEPNYYSQENIYEDINLYVLPSELYKIPTQSQAKENNICSESNETSWSLTNLPKKFALSFFTEKQPKKGEIKHLSATTDDIYITPNHNKNFKSILNESTNFFQRSTAKSATSGPKDIKKFKINPPKLIRRQKVIESISLPLNSTNVENYVNMHPIYEQTKSDMDESISLVNEEECIYLTPGIQQQVPVVYQLDQKPYLEFPCPQCKETHKILMNCIEINIFPILFDPTVADKESNIDEVCNSNTCKNLSITKIISCITCQLNICKYCMDNFHDNHFCLLIEKFLDSENSRIKDLIIDVTMRIDDRIENQKLLEDKINRLEKRKLKSINKIQKYRSYLIDSIDRETQTLIQEIEESYANTKKNIQKTINEIDDQINMFKYTIDYSNFTINNSKPSNILSNQLLINRLYYLKYENFNLDYNKRPSVKLNTMNFNKEDVRELYGLTIKEKLIRKRDKSDSKLEIQKPIIINSFSVKKLNDELGSKPTSIIITNNDEIIIADSVNKRIKIFDTKGCYKQDLITTEGIELCEPCSVFCSEKFDEIYITDLYDLKIFSLNSGIYKKSITEGLSKPSGVVLNSLGNILISDIIKKKKVPTATLR